MLILTDGSVEFIEGVIIKAISGFFYVSVDDKLYQCRARGIFKKNKIVPLVGDRVRIKLLPNDEIDEGWIEQIYPRTTVLARPAVANVDQAIIVFALKHPDPHINLLDKLIVMIEKAGLKPIICLNKLDIDGAIQAANKYQEIYEMAGYPVITSSFKTGKGVEELKEFLIGKTSVFAGPSGVGKSSLLNSIQEGLSLKTGVVSHKIFRGKHTTRHTELFELTNGGWVLDTPGFTSMDISSISEDELPNLFVEFNEYTHKCRFQNCLHFHEPDCGVKQAVTDNKIHSSRYESYLYFLNELKESRESYD